MAVCGIHVKALALQLNMFRDCYGSQVNMAIPQTLWRSHICQKPVKKSFKIDALSFKLNCIVLHAYAFKNQGHKLKTPNSHDLSHVGESLVFIDIKYIQSTRKNLSSLARQNEFHKSLNNETFSRFKRFHAL